MAEIAALLPLTFAGTNAHIREMPHIDSINREKLSRGKFVRNLGPKITSTIGFEFFTQLHSLPICHHAFACITPQFSQTITLVQDFGNYSSTDCCDRIDSQALQA